MFPSDPALPHPRRLERSTGPDQSKGSLLACFPTGYKEKRADERDIPNRGPRFSAGLFFGLAAIKENPARGERGFPNPFGEH